MAARLVASARSGAPVSGHTHAHYKYPARFSPLLVRAAIETFTKPGDLVFDPFIGGGTTAVEGLALGRDIIGTDISSLAVFVAEAKTLRLSPADIVAFNRWAEIAPLAINMHLPTTNGWWEEAGYVRNIESRTFWRLRKAISQLLATVQNLPPASETLARCAVLRASQWAVEGRKYPPSMIAFRRYLGDCAKNMLADAIAFSASVSEAAGLLGREPQATLLQRSAVGLETDQRVSGRTKPRLVLTSPPYPGVHVLYHRWQVEGRRETPAPFWIANRLDGSGESYYTLGHRGNPGLRTYFDNLQASFASIAALADRETIFVQVVAFSDPTWQLPRYLSALIASGLGERLLPDLDTADGRLWRRVPGRRWYADQRGPTAAAHEVVLFFQLNS